MVTYGQGQYGTGSYGELVPVVVDPANIVATGNYFTRTQVFANTVRAQARLRVTLDHKVQTIGTVAAKVDVIGGLQP